MSEEQKTNEAPAWLIKLGPTIRGAQIFHHGQKIQKVARVELEASAKDATTIVITAFSFDTKIEAEDGTQITLIDGGKCVGCPLFADSACPHNVPAQLPPRERGQQHIGEHGRWCRLCYPDPKPEAAS